MTSESPVVTAPSKKNTTTAPTSTPTSTSAGRELLLELKRSRGGNAQWLPPYNAPLVRQCLGDVQDSVNELGNQVQAATLTDQTNKPSMASRPSILWHHACIQRQKRCLLAYHKHRLDILRSLDEPPKQAHPAEDDFVQAYQELRQSYSTAVFDLNSIPPTSHPLTLQVRVLQELGPVVLESGRSITLTKGSLLHLPRSDVVDFLKNGSMELLEGEEVDF